MIGIVFYAMLFCHIVDDFYLQGVLANLKQESWWEERFGKDSIYKDDYLVALIEHGFSWAFMIMLPILIHMICVGRVYTEFYCLSVCVNMTIHTIIDNAKANHKTINLWQDQGMHFIQIAITMAAYLILRTVTGG